MVARRDTPYWNDRQRGLPVRIEPGVGGRFVEVYDLETGSGMEVGRVTAWEPGRRLALTWTQVGWPQDASTELEITFEPAGDGTRVRLEHSGSERVPGAIDFIAGYDAGWKEVLGWFVEHADRPATERNRQRLGIFTGSTEEVGEIMDHDPGVKAGIFTYELHPVRGFPGSSLR